MFADQGLRDHGNTSAEFTVERGTTRAELYIDENDIFAEKRFEKTGMTDNGHPLDIVINVKFQGKRSSKRLG